MHKAVALFCICAISAITAQVSSNCDSQEKCSECIQQPGCIWCSNPAGNEKTHCQLETDVINTNWCHANSLVKPELENKILKNKYLNSGKQGEAVQIKPQLIKIRARRGEETKFSFQYAKAASYPVDLYYIMDLSASMKVHKNRLSKLGGSLVSVMRNITTNFRLGFGSFVDKNTMPFTNTFPDRLASPCPGCVPAYSFRNHLSLTNNYALFSEQVNAANLSGNMDAPEGGFDAIMQAIVCKDVIGWRANARHLIVFSSDTFFHVAGDGKLAGAYEPNDGICHMERNEYTKALKFDYPSVSYLNFMAKDNNINLIFAVDKGSYKIYKKLQENIANSAVGKLDAQSSNVVDLILDNYNKIADSVLIADNSTSTVEIKYHASCKSSIENGCSNLQLDEIVNFTATIKPLECHRGRPNTYKIQVKPEGVNEALIIDLDVVCNCDCEQPGSPDYIVNSNDCGKQGNKTCGVCKCKEDYFGSTCECHANHMSIMDLSDTNCKQDQNNSKVCSNLGECKCGKCDCDKRSAPDLISGKYCECTNYACPIYKGELCGGPDRGRCVCSKCECHSGWIGEDCSCKNTTVTCMAPNGDGKICSDHGNCECGECQCVNDDKKYSGKYCDECATCQGQRCQELQSCVECQAYHSGSYNAEDCRTRCTEFNTTTVDEIDTEVESEWIKTCLVLDSAGCSITFQYTYIDDQNVVVEALKDKSCPEPIDILVVVLSVIGSIVLGGLIIIAICKFVTHIYDSREYAKFLNDTQGAKWVRDENPLYKGASTTFQNPAFNQSRSK